MISLASIVPSPLSSPRQLDWERLEEEIGFPLPDDYREIVESYGPGLFSDFIFIFDAVPDNLNIYIREQDRLAIEALRYLEERGNEVIPFQVSPTSELIGCGRTVNGDMLYWRTRFSDDPNAWTIVGNESRGDEWFEYQGGLDQFLTACLSGEDEYEFPFLWEDGVLEPTFTFFR